MKKLALVFVLAIFAPALLLGVLALRTAGRQRMIMQQQEVELRQKETDELAEKVRVLLADEQRTFLDAVERLRARVGLEALGQDFSGRLPGEWGRDCIGFAIDQNGLLVSPGNGAKSDAATQEFLRENAAFLGNQAPAEVYQPYAKNSVQAAPQLANENEGLNDRYNSSNQASDSAQLQKSAAKAVGTQSFATRDSANKSAVAAPQGAVQAASSEYSPTPPRATFGYASSLAGRQSTNAQQQEAQAVNTQASEPQTTQGAQAEATLKSEVMGKILSQKMRAVFPQNQISAPSVPVSQLNFATSRFRQLVADGHDGILARFVEDELVVIFWVRPAGLDQYILGAQIKASVLFDAIRPGLDPLASRDACLAILDDHARPAVLSVPGFTTNWKNPFVATELGETLPHWEAALYLLNPDSVSQSAHLITLTLYGLVGLAIGAIAWGSLLIAADTRRQVRLAQRKTDFVSNVSHELKTPLTSIRMFAELLQEGRVSDPAKTADYLRIIRLEAERLTRLINNVLDFARLERNQKHYTRRLIDLRPEIERLWEAQSEHLRAQGFSTGAEIAPGPWWALVDADAIVQVIVNLLSNAEKYSPAQKEIELHASLENDQIRISILDRGAGVPPGEEKKIFESFHRAHDSLSSGIPGSGLGLTLALRIARDHGGDLRHDRRPGGGSIFTLTLPTTQSPEAH